MSSFKLDFILSLPEFFLISATLLLLLLGLGLERVGIGPASAVSAGAILALCLYISLFFSRLLYSSASFWDSGFRFFFLNSLFGVLLLFSTLLFLLLSHQFYRRDSIFTYEFPLLILFSTFGYLLVVGCSSFLTLYLSLELSAFCLYIMAALRRTSLFSTEAGLKYFLLGALASSLLLLGTALLYGLGGSVRFDDWALLLYHWDSLPETGLFWLSVALIGVGLLTKLSIAPFHFWTPDVYGGAPIGVVAYFASISKIAPVGILAQLLYGLLSPLSAFLSPYLLLFGLLSVVVGTLGALRQERVKRLLAYSGVAHSGYILLALSTNHPLGLVSVLVYVSVYVLLSLDFFGSLFPLLSYSGRGVRTIKDLLVLSRSNPFSAFSLSTNLFSIAGIPPFAGFLPKFLVLLSLLFSSCYISAVLLVLVSVVATVYYIRLVRILYFDRPYSWTFYRPSSQISNLATGATLSGNLLLLPLFSVSLPYLF